MDGTSFRALIDEFKFDAVMLGWSRDFFSDPTALWHSASAVRGGLNYYRASPMVPPSPADPGARKLQLKPGDFTVKVPTLVVWGERDAALLPGCLDGLDAVVPDLKLVRVPDASHWIARERTELVIREIEAFTISR